MHISRIRQRFKKIYTQILGSPLSRSCFLCFFPSISCPSGSSKHFNICFLGPIRLLLLAEVYVSCYINWGVSLRINNAGQARIFTWFSSFNCGFPSVFPFLTSYHEMRKSEGQNHLIIYEYYERKEFPIEWEIKFYFTICHIVFEVKYLDIYQCWLWITEKAMAPHSSTPAWKIPWTEERGRLQSMGSLRVGHDWATSLSLSTFMHWRRKWPPTPVFLPGESQGLRSLVGCRLWGHTQSDTTEVT